MVKVVLSAITLSLCAALTVQALPHTARKSEFWHHPEDHPVRNLFKRQSPSPQPGSPEWVAQFPAPAKITASMLPAAWINALHAAESSGLIPNISVGAQTSSGSNPTYGTQDPNSPAICSSTYQCRGDGDIWDGPASTVSISFDDGPADGSTMLYDFLIQQKIPSTHFLIGSNIVQSVALFNRLYHEAQGDLAVHTWSHLYTTTLSNEVVVGELGFTLQAIHDLADGKLARFWRPPYGDSDNRVRAIAKHVFGLTQVNWNQDSNDWQIDENKLTVPSVEASIQKWYTGPKTPGLVILEHELSNNTSGCFINTYPGIQANGWQSNSLAQVFGGAYQNALTGVNAQTNGSDVLPGPPNSTQSAAAQAPTGTQPTSNDSGSSDGKISGLKKNASVRKASVSIFAMLLPLLATIFT